MIDNPNPQLRYAIIALVSIVSSTLRGVEYLIYNNNMVVIQRIIKVSEGLNSDFEGTIK
jgi:hypothetical protein